MTEMRALYFILIFLAPLLVQAACKNVIDAKRVMLFIDTNTNPLEIKAAQTAACERGETIVIIPKNAGVNQASLEMQIRTELKKIKKDDGKLKNLIISGHDGGGIFKGTSFKTNRAELYRMLNIYPEINEINSLLLLGCYSGVQKEILAWKNLLPKIRLIAGYDAAAPLGIRPAGHEYIRDILTKEKKLTAITDKKKIENYLKHNISIIKDLNSSLYLRPYCEDEKQNEFFFGSFDNKKEITNLDFKDCAATLPKLEEEAANFIKYSSGELDPREGKNYEHLRQLYKFSRRNEHCIDAFDIPLNVNSIFNLVFLTDVNENFVKFYKNDITKAAGIITASKNLSHKIWVPTIKNLKNKTYAQMLENINNMHGLLVSSDLTASQREALRFLSSSMSKHLQHFENPFSWFEVHTPIEAPSHPEKFNLGKK